MSIWDDETRSYVNVYEQITRESIERADMSDVIVARNHNFDKILGRNNTAEGHEPTASFTITDKGVEYRLNSLPNTTYANDLKESVSRGDIHGSSFTFTPDWDLGYEFTERSDGSIVATPKAIKRVYEMGPVTNPAYPATTAENRSGLLFKGAKSFLKNRNAPEEELEQEQDRISDDEMNELEARLRMKEKGATL